MNHFSNIISILISILAIIEAKSLVQHHGRQAENFGILLCNRRERSHQRV